MSYLENNGKTKKESHEENGGTPMKKFLAIALVLTMALMAGCAPTQVHVCPESLETQAATEAPAQVPEASVPAGAVKTGLAIVTDVAGSTPAADGAEGVAEFNVTLVAVTVDGKGVIDSCVIDSIKSQVNFGADGSITTDLTAAPATKNELGDAYGMKAYGGAAYEWYEQAQALADYAVGKTVEELKNGAVDESGKAADADLASVATIHLGGFVSAIEKAAANARDLGAMAGDKLTLTTLNSLESSTGATAEAGGLVQLDANVVALTRRGEVITSCILDAVQAKVEIDAAGAILTDLTAAPQTKNELGEAYGMKMYAGSAYEWNEQAAAFAAYVTGKTAEEVAGIAVGERAEPTDADLASTVTISVGGFQGLIAKACR